MKAIELSPPGGLDNLKLVERPKPQPGPGQALLRLRAVSLNYRDWIMVSGAHEVAQNPFSDGCAIVEAVGEGVTRVKPGDRVATIFYQAWLSGRQTPEMRASVLGGSVGVGAEYVVLSEDGLVKPPEFLTDQQVATLPCAGLTAWRGLMVDARLKPGDSVLLQGTGGVSIFGLQFAHAAGLETIITSSSDAKLERAKALGADHLVNYRTHPVWSKEARRITGGRGVDFIMEVGGAGTLKESLKSIVIGGHIAVVGILAGAQEPLNIPVMFGTAARLQGLSVGSREMFEDMCRAIEKHRINPVVDKLYPFTEVRAAFEAMKAGEHFGKIVLTFD